MDIIVTGELTPERRRALAQRQNAELAASLINSPGWEWFTKQCDAKATALERALLDMGRHLDVRDEDRYRGAAEAYRSMPRMMVACVQNFNKQVEAQKASAAASKGDQR